MQKTMALPKVENDRPVTFENIRYGMLVEFLDNEGGGYHSGVKVHFFNKKGVLIGNYYQFVTYDRLRLRQEKRRYYPRYFMGSNYLKKNVPFSEKAKTWLFIRLCNFISFLFRFTQRIMD